MQNSSLNTMTDLDLVITSLQSKIEKLILLHKTHEEENTKLLFEKNKDINTIEWQDRRIKELEKLNFEIQDSARLSVERSSDSSENKEKINKLVTEIDECLALLNK